MSVYIALIPKLQVTSEPRSPTQSSHQVLLHTFHDFAQIFNDRKNPGPPKKHCPENFTRNMIQLFVINKYILHNFSVALQHHCLATRLQLPMARHRSSG